MKLWLRYTTAGMMICNSFFAETIGIINGENSSYVALVDSSFSLTTLPLTEDIHAVDMNSSGTSVIAGSNTTKNWAALVNSLGQITPFSNNNALSSTTLSGAAINTSGYSISGGGSGPVVMDAADPLGNASFIDGGSTPTTCGLSNTGRALTAAINDSGWIVVGGNAGENPNRGIWAATIAPGSLTSNEIICASNSSGSTIYEVSLNNSNNAIAGGHFAGAPYAVLFNASETSPTFTQISFPFTQGQLFSASIAESGTSLTGGVDTLTSAPFAALITPSGQLLPCSPLPSTGAINSVDLVDGFGYGIIAGQDTTTQAAYAAYVDILGHLHPVSGLPTGASASISSVSINAWGAALVGGTLDGVNPYAALIIPLKGVTALDITGSGVSDINDVSIRKFLTPIGPFHFNLYGNNRIFAEYLVHFAPKKALYFSPSVFNGTLAEALESAAPTRNAISVFSADNNLFYLSNSLSEHFRNRRQYSRHKQLKKTESLAALDRETDRLMVSAELGSSFSDEPCAPANPASESIETHLSQEKPAAPEPMPASSVHPKLKSPSNCLWSQIIGAFASQKEQRQTPGFQPSVGGIMIGWDKKTIPGRGRRRSVLLQQPDHAGRANL